MVEVLLREILEGVAVDLVATAVEYPNGHVKTKGSGQMLRSPTPPRGFPAVFPRLQLG